MEYDSVTKRNEALAHATKWMEVENMLREQSQTQKVTYYRMPFKFYFKLHPE